MRISFLLPVLACAALANLEGQSLPKDITRSFDTFTDDTIYETKYGRLDNPSGCGRDNLAIIWELARGKKGQAEFMVYKYFDPGNPFSAGDFIGGHAAFLNIDGDIFEVKPERAIPRLSADRKMRSEDAAFLLPEGTLQRIAMATNARLRIVGTQKTCDGVIEGNMRLRLRVLFSYLKAGSP